MLLHRGGSIFERGSVRVSIRINYSLAFSGSKRGQRRGNEGIKAGWGEKRKARAIEARFKVSNFPEVYASVVNFASTPGLTTLSPSPPPPPRSLETWLIRR